MPSFGDINISSNGNQYVEGEVEEEESDADAEGDDQDQSSGDQVKRRSLPNLHSVSGNEFGSGGSSAGGAVSAQNMENGSQAQKKRAATMGNTEDKNTKRRKSKPQNSGTYQNGVQMLISK